MVAKAHNPNGVAATRQGFLLKMNGACFRTNNRSNRSNHSVEPQPRWGCGRDGGFPRVARASQPWALGRNPVGIRETCHCSTKSAKMVKTQTLCFCVFAFGSRLKLTSP